MDFEYTEEQIALRDVVREALSKSSSTERLRALWDGEPDDGSRWRELVEMGIAGLTVPEAQGGMGAGAVDLSLVHEELGYACAPDAMLEVGVAAAVFAADVAAGGASPAGEWLAGLAAGELRVALKLDDDRFASGALGADLFLIADADAIQVVAASDVDVDFVQTQDAIRSLAAVGEPRARQALAVPSSLARTHARLGAAAQLVGVNRRLLDMCAEYAKQRQQFAVPIGSFQAIQHKLSSMFIDGQAAHAAVRYAAYAIDAGQPDAAHAAAVAKATANDALSFAERESLQIFAGIGFTWEHDLHFWLKRGQALRGSYGTTRVLRAELAQSAIVKTRTAGAEAKQ